MTQARQVFMVNGVMYPIEDFDFSKPNWTSDITKAAVFGTSVDMKTFVTKDDLPGGNNVDMFKIIAHMDKIMDEAWSAMESELKLIRKFISHDVVVRVYRSGMCHWNKIQFYVNAEIKPAYLLTNANNIRKEYFYGKLVRTYTGCQNCFVEFCGQLPLDRFPTDDEFDQIGNILQLTGEVVRMYKEMYQLMFIKA